MRVDDFVVVDGIVDVVGIFGVGDIVDVDDVFL